MKLQDAIVVWRPNTNLVRVVHKELPMGTHTRG